MRVTFPPLVTRIVLCLRRWPGRYAFPITTNRDDHRARCAWMGPHPWAK